MNAVLQVLVHSPPLWNLFRQLGDLRGTGGPETGGGATPLVDATSRFFEEFILKEKQLPPTQQMVRQAARKEPKKDEVEKKENKTVNSLEPTYLYEAMKGKRQLKHLLVRSRCLVA